MKERKQIGIILQVAVLFIISMLISSAISYAFQFYTTNETIQQQTESLGERIAQEMTLAIREYPTYSWLMKYWYENADNLDIEYDATYAHGTRTEQKYMTLHEHHPDLLIEYEDTKAIEALPPEDQKLYAEIVYSWVTTRINEIKRSYDVDYLFCVLSDPPHDRQFFLLSAAEEGAVRGPNYKDVYLLGKTVEVTDSLRLAMDSAAEHSSHLANAGSYADYYASFGMVDGHDIFIGMTYDLSGLRNTVLRQTQRGTLLSLVSLLALLSIALLLLSHFILRPLKKVQQNIRLYKRTKNSRDVQRVSSRNEIGQLSEDVVSLARSIDDYVLRIESITSEKERMSTELSLASRIQAGALPSTFPPFPDRHEFELFASMDPAREVGGDFYDFFMIDDDHLALLIADVSGKGVPAALFMMVSMLLIRNAVKNEHDPARALARVNDQICSKNPEEMFVSVWLGILEISTGKLTAVDAGHEFPIIKQPDGHFEIMQDPHGFVLGGLAGMSYDNYELQLEPGSTLFLYTDGVPEATDPQHQLFGMRRLVEALNREPQAGPEQLMKNVRQDVDVFVKNAEQFDDLTMLCLKYLGPHQEEQQ